MKISMDNKAHFFVGYCISITAALGLIVGGITSMQMAALLGLLAAANVGILKEVWDILHPASRRADLRDEVSTLLGGALAGVVVTGMAMMVTP